VGPHAPEERLDVVDGSGVDELAIIEPQANPEVVHEDGESSHNSTDAPWTTKFVAAKIIVGYWYISAGQIRVRGTHNSWVSSRLSMARPCSEMTTLSVFATRGEVSDAPLAAAEALGDFLRSTVAMRKYLDALRRKGTKTSNDFPQTINGRHQRVPGLPITTLPNLVARYGSANLQQERSRRSIGQPLCSEFRSPSLSLPPPLTRTSTSTLQVH